VKTAIVVWVVALSSLIAVAEDSAAVRKWREHRDRAEELLAHRRKAVSEDAIRAADAEYAKAVRIAREHGLTDLAFDGLRGRLDCVLSLSDYPGALAVSREILEVQEAIPGRKGKVARVKTRCDIGYLLTSLGSPREAIRVLSVAETDALALDDQPLLAAARLRLAAALSDRSGFAAALGAVEWAVRAFRENRDERSLAEALNIKGTIHTEVGNPEYALQCLAAARKLDSGEDPEMAAQLDANTAVAYIDLGRHKEAWELLKKARTRFQEAGDTPGEAMICFWLGRLYRQTKQYDASLEWSRRARKLVPKDPRIVGWAWLTEADALLAKREDTGAQAAFERALGFVERLDDSDLECRGEGGLAAIQFREGKPKEAMVHLRRSLEHIGDLTRGHSPLTAMKIRARYGVLLDGAVRTAFATGDVELIYEMIERARAGVLMAAIGGREAFAVERVAPGIWREVLDARAECCAARDRHEQALAGGRVEPARKSAAALTRARIRQQEALERWYRSSPGCIVGESLEPRSLADVRGKLAAGEVVVLYALTRRNARALVVRKRGATVVDLGPHRKLHDALVALRDSIVKGRDVQGIEELRELLIAPLGLSRRERRVMVSPDRFLKDVPLALLAPDREVSFIPSASSWVALAERGKGRGDRLLAMGAPVYSSPQRRLSGEIFRSAGSLVDLPHARGEVKDICRKGDRCLIGEAATESGFRRAIVRTGRWRAIHFACHGLLSPHRPGMTSLALTPEVRDDGFLTVLEILGMRLSADLVTLSACETGTGPVLSGEGLIALPHAFLHAGVPRVIGSLWPVDDKATRILMNEFYRRWNPERGKSKISAAAAMKRAQEAVRKKGYEHPRFWAGWVLWGLAD